MEFIWYEVNIYYLSQNLKRLDLPIVKIIIGLGLILVTKKMMRF